MSRSTKPRWDKMRTDETRRVEQIIRKIFPDTDAYRYNSASIRVRIIDDRFEGKSDEEREDMIQRILGKLSQRTRDDIVNLLTLTRDETTGFNRRTLLNEEFEDPSPSKL